MFSSPRKGSACRIALKLKTLLQKIRINLKEQICLEVFSEKKSIWVLTNFIKCGKRRSQVKRARTADYTERTIIALITSTPCHDIFFSYCHHNFSVSYHSKTIS